MVMDLCTRCIVMKDGSILADAPVPDIFADCALLEEARLEQPLSYCLSTAAGKRKISPHTAFRPAASGPVPEIYPANSESALIINNYNYLTINIIYTFHAKAAYQPEAHL